MYNIKMVNYVPEPMPATSDRIVAAHYYAAWKKGAAGLHNGFDDLHDYPERTPLMGYYDEENPEVCDWEIKWATEHGINCFIYCWYRKLENMGKPITVSDLRCGHGLHEAMFNARYQKYMKFAIMFENSPRWGTTDAEDAVTHLMPFWTETYFKRDNYLKINNKPVLFIYHQKRLDGVFPNPADQKAMFDACREYALRQGFDGMVFALCDTKLGSAACDEAIARGYDFRFGYNSGYIAPVDYYADEDDIVNQQCSLLRQRLESDCRRFVPTASCFSDAQHWRDMGYTFHLGKRWYLQPDNFRRVLEKMKEISDTLPADAWGRKIMMIDNWNEWDEGHFVAPSYQFGFRYLQAIREVFTARDNLPDYRTPQTLGLTDYNKNWAIPDFTEVCKEKYHL